MIDPCRICSVPTSPTGPTESNLQGSFFALLFGWLVCSHKHLLLIWTIFPFLILPAFEIGLQSDAVLQNTPDFCVHLLAYLAYLQPRSRRHWIVMFLFSLFKGSVKIYNVTRQAEHSDILLKVKPSASAPPVSSCFIPGIP